MYMYMAIACKFPGTCTILLPPGRYPEGNEMKPEDLRKILLCYFFNLGPGLYSPPCIFISHYVCNHMHTYYLKIQSECDFLCLDFRVANISGSEKKKKKSCIMNIWLTLGFS